MTQLTTCVVLFTFVTTLYAKKCYRTNETEVCPISMQTLDFLGEDLSKHNISDVEWQREFHRNYPCEFITFWAEGSFKAFVDVLRFVYKYFFPVEIAVGVAWNILVLLMILSKQSLQKQKGKPSAVYLMGYYQCWSDIGALLITCTMGYVRSYSSAFNHLIMSNMALCRAFKIFTTVFEFLSPWLNVIIVVHRLCDIKRSARGRATITRKRVHCTMVCLFTLAFTIAATKFYFSGFEEYSVFEYRSCETRGRTHFVVATVYVALATYLPSTLILFFNFKLVNIIIKGRSNTSFQDLLHDSQLMRRRKAETRRIISVIAAVSVFYTIVQFPLGVLEMTELYWNLVKRRTFCRSDRSEFANWRIFKMILKWVRALFYPFHQLGFIINFSCLLCTPADFQKIKNRYGSTSLSKTTIKPQRQQKKQAVSDS